MAIGADIDTTATAAASRVPAWVSNLAIVLVIAALWPINALLADRLNPYFFQVLIVIGINITLAVSLNLINGITGQFSLGHAGFMALGAYTSAILMRHFSPSGAAAEALFLGALLLAGLMAAVAGIVVGVPALRLRGDYLAIATLGFGEIINVLIVNTETIGRFEVGGASGLHGIPIVTNFFWTYAVALVCIVCIWRLAHSSKGKAFLAVREDEIAAAAMGVDTTYHKVAAFVIGAFFAGVAGGISAMWFGDLDPESFRFMRSIEIVAMVVLGGSGSVTGAVLAAVVLTVLPEALRDVRQYTGGQDLRLIIYSLLLIVMMLVRPEGLLGRRELWWTRRRTPAAVKAARALDVPDANPPVA
ncbi:MAG TPA: branched-chain amino acid ABC transporter permease [Tepidisphaeraceae bacterium]|jgi:branched-chain amino acid transport system permease protein